MTVREPNKKQNHQLIEDIAGSRIEIEFECDVIAVFGRRSLPKDRQLADADASIEEENQLRH